MSPAGGPGPGVEDAAAVAALVVQDRVAVAVVDPQALPLTAWGQARPSGWSNSTSLP